MGEPEQTMVQYPLKDADSGAELMDPSEMDSPAAFAGALFAANGEPLEKDKFLGLCKLMFQIAMEEEDAPGQEFKGMMCEALGGMGVDEEKAVAVFNDVSTKVRDIVVPFVGTAIFEWIDRDKSKGITKDEVEAIMTLAMEGPAAGLSLLFSAMDYDKNGALDAEEVAKFLAEIFKVVSKCAHCVLDTLAAAFKEDVVSMAVQQVFMMLDENGDGKLEPAELAPMKEALEEMTAELKKVQNDEDIPPPLLMLIDDAHKIKAFAEAEGEQGADYEKFKDFNMKLIEGRMELLKQMINSEDVTDTVPPGIYAKIKEFEGPAIEALMSAATASLEDVSKAAFHLIDANGDGKLDKEECLGLGGIMNPDISADDKFKYSFALVDTDGEGFCDKDELVTFARKVFDFAIAMAKCAVDLGCGVGTSIGALAIVFVMSKVFGDGQITEDGVKCMLAEVEEDGPEALLGKLMAED